MLLRALVWASAEPSCGPALQLIAAFRGVDGIAALMGIDGTAALMGIDGTAGSTARHPGRGRRVVVTLHGSMDRDLHGPYMVHV